MARTKKPPGERCAWRYEANDAISAFRSDCGMLFEFNDGSPAANGFKFCPGCGKPLKDPHR